jgi:DNA polymerase
MQSGAADALAVVHEHILVCTDCPLHLKRTQAVPGTGPAGARIMAVGEGPGETEDRLGRPFVGAAGNVLTKLLESIGLRRDDIYITNVVKCRPPGNRDPEPAEMEACSHFLDAQIEIIRPDVILILGRHALARLLPGAGGISGLHGSRVVRGDRLYVPLYHPAAALYQGSLMRTLEDDMRKVRGYLDEAEARRRQPLPAAVPEGRAVASASATPPAAPPPPAEPLLRLASDEPDEPAPRLAPPEPDEPALRLGSPDPVEPAPPSEPPGRDQLSLF